MTEPLVAEPSAISNAVETLTDEQDADADDDDDNDDESFLAVPQSNAGTLRSLLG